MQFMWTADKNSSFYVVLVGAREGGRELFDDPSYVNVDKPRPPAAANGNAHRDAFDMSKWLTWSHLCFIANITST